MRLPQSRRSNALIILPSRGPFRGRPPPRVLPRCANAVATEPQPATLLLTQRNPRGAAAGTGVAGFEEKERRDCSRGALVVLLTRAGVRPAQTITPPSERH